MKPDHLITTVGRALRWMREERQLRQFEVAQAAKITRPMLSAYETGKQSPALATLGRILKALDTDLLELAETVRLLERSSTNTQQTRSRPTPADPAETEAFEQIEVAVVEWLRRIRAQVHEVRQAGT